ncbi:hypothetical protein [Roseicyclus mahoneyensis]|jgi:hypothetical protein|uniref:Lipoprotein n=1 Tax=Roseicyclus mahoneyensis TaxID=164332 RepID=A0A316GRS7_9RHOB|nr:hypothetical protein [Roseicyclus mahoneyensis]PWK62762.1 hypothetical protein C7455_101798 [Roseicyclus mahoneyensis]
MRLTLAIVITAVTLSGCVTGSTYYAEGVDIATRDAYIAACDRQALTDFPIRNETRYTPRRYVPPRQICDSAGVCVTQPGYFEGGDPYTVDVNAPFRRTAAQGCMGARGYARIGLPRCEEGTQIRLSTVMPQLTGGTCLYSPGPGPALIVNPI